MKNFLLFFLCTLALSVNAQVRTTTRANVNQGTYLDYPGQWSTIVPAPSQCDTLQVSDTVAYIIPISHMNDVDIVHSFFWTKYGAGTATLSLKFYQGNDPWYFVQCTQGVAQTAYAKSFSLSATTSTATPEYISFKTDSVNFTGRYLKVVYMTSNTASVGGKIISRTKTTIK